MPRAVASCRLRVASNDISARWQREPGGEETQRDDYSALVANPRRRALAPQAVNNPDGELPFAKKRRLKLRRWKEMHEPALIRVERATNGD